MAPTTYVVTQYTHGMGICYNGILHISYCKCSCGKQTCYNMHLYLFSRLITNLKSIGILHNCNSEIWQHYLACSISHTVIIDSIAYVYYSEEVVNIVMFNSH